MRATATRNRWTIFLAKYWEDLEKGDTYHVADITANEVYARTRWGAPTAEGLDGFKPAEASLLSEKAAQVLADLYNDIEQGAPWPEDWTQARVAFLEKEGADGADALKYRPLLVLAFGYRLWAKLRLRAIEPWARTWETDEMHAGLPGTGADIAWWRHAFEFEEVQTQGGDDEFLAAAIDVWKCYDQVKKMLPVKLAIIAGCPPRVIMAYARMHAGLTIRNTVGGKLGGSPTCVNVASRRAAPCRPSC